MFWTPKQRLALSLLLTLILTFLLIRHFQNPNKIPNPQPIEGARAQELLDKLDPNTASAGDLAALPNLGPAMSRRILEDREQFLKQNPTDLPYKTLKDLERIKGIGPATLENLKPYLIFPAPSTQPATP